MHPQLRNCLVFVAGAALGTVLGTTAYLRHHPPVPSAVPSAVPSVVRYHMNLFKGDRVVPLIQVSDDSILQLKNGDINAIGCGNATLDVKLLHQQRQIATLQTFDVTVACERRPASAPRPIVRGAAFRWSAARGLSQ